MNTVLLTGGRGYVGSHILPKLLEQDYTVHAVTSRQPEQTDSAIHWHQANLLDPDQTKPLLAQIKPTHLLHLAWYVEYGAYWTALENFRWVQSSLDLLMAFQENGGQRAVVAGTCAEYDWQYGYCRENHTPLNPATLYGTCKDALQKLMTVHAAQTGYSTAWGRIFFTFGAREQPKRLVPAVIRALLANQTIPTSHGEQIRDFLYIEDLADAFVRLLGSPVTGAVNLASGSPVKLKDITAYIGQRLNRSDLIQRGVLPAPANDPPLLLADVSRLKDEVGWQPQHDLWAALDQTIEWHKQQLKSEG